MWLMTHTPPSSLTLSRYFVSAFFSCWLRCCLTYRCKNNGYDSAVQQVSSAKMWSICTSASSTGGNSSRNERQPTAAEKEKSQSHLSLFFPGPSNRPHTTYDVDERFIFRVKVEKFFRADWVNHEWKTRDWSQLEWQFQRGPKYIFVFLEYLVPGARRRLGQRSSSPFVFKEGPCK